jgi:hypothetical protein
VSTAQLQTQPEKPPEFRTSKESKENKNHTNIICILFSRSTSVSYYQDILLDPSLVTKTPPIASQFLVIPDANSEYFTNTLLAVSMVCRHQS